MIDMTLEYIGSYDFDGEPILTDKEIVRCRCGRYPDWFDIKLDGFCKWGERKERKEQ